jgi:hypothetical protein
VSDGTVRRPLWPETECPGVRAVGPSLETKHHLDGSNAHGPCPVNIGLVEIQWCLILFCCQGQCMVDEHAHEGAYVSDEYPGSIKRNALGPVATVFLDVAELLIGSQLGMIQVPEGARDRAELLIGR